MTAPARTFEIKPAVREQVPLLVGIVGPSGSGKTWSALRVATGIQRVTGGDIAVIDTEARRALHYSDRFKFRHLDFRAPFGSLDYLAAIQACVAAGSKIVVIDSASHEHEGPGGMVDFQEQELARMAGDDYQKRERMKMLAWAKPKAARRKFIGGLLQLNCNFIFCFRAKSVSKPVKQGGKTEVVQMGFVPVSGDELVFEMTANVLLLPKSGGVPTWESDYPGEAMAMKLPEQFKDVFARPEPLSEEIGQKLAHWAAGSVPKAPPTVKELLDLYAACETDEVLTKLEQQRGDVWNQIPPPAQSKLKAASEAARKRVAEKTAPEAPDDGVERDEFGATIFGCEPEDSLFNNPSDRPVD